MTKNRTKQIHFIIFFYFGHEPASIKKIDNYRVFDRNNNFNVINTQYTSKYEHADLFKITLCRTHCRCIHKSNVTSHVTSLRT